MKNYKFIYTILIAGVMMNSACQKNEINVAPAKLSVVANLNHSLNGDTATFSWTLPDSESPIKVIIENGENSIETPISATSYKYGIIETNKEYNFSFKIKDADGNLSLGKVVNILRKGATPVSNLNALQDDNGILVSWTLPKDPLTKIRVKFGTQTLDLSGIATSQRFTNIPTGNYDISVVTYNSENLSSNTTYLPFKVGVTVIGYLGVYPDSLTLLNTGDDDQVAAAKWLFSQYRSAQYISFNDVKTGAKDLSKFRVLWWNHDVSTSTNLPDISTDAAVVTKITQYYKNGGNLLFDKYALKYYNNLGRITEPYFTEYGGGDGFFNPDAWGLGVKIGRKQDKSNHPVFKNITKKVENDGRITFPIIGPGWKENHNAVFIRIPEYLKLEPNDNEASYNKFASDNNLEWLAQWDGIGDYWMVGIFELKPKADFKGSSIFFGIGAIEFKQNSGVNPHQATVETMYKNALEYLKTK
nr:DUF4960 domain-containing protein [Pedobacter glucosidilyticus]